MIKKSPGKATLLQAVVLIFCTFPVAVQAESSADLRSFIESISISEANSEVSPRIVGRLLQSPDAVRRFYFANGHTLLWTQGGSLASQYPDLIEAISASAGHGFDPQRYHADLLKSAHDHAGMDHVAREILATDAFLTQVRHRSSGVVAPRQLNPDWHLIPEERDAVALLLQLSSSGGVLVKALEDSWPRHSEYRVLVTERARILALGDTVSVIVPDGPLLKPGQSGRRIELLKDRLLGPGDHDDVFDAGLQTAVVNLQLAAGLEPDGLVGNVTLEVLNAGPVSWIDRIDANLERWRWLPSNMPQDLLRINIAAFHLRAIKGGEDELDMKLIVGRPFRQTPVFTELLKYMVLNPFWNVPFNLATQDKLPLLKSDPLRLQSMGYEVRLRDSNQFVPVTEVNWETITRRNFDMFLRQRPGPGNALGQIKFMLPNEFAIYLHDTNEKTLFSKQERSFSSGCIRLSEPVALAQWLLRNEHRDADADSIQALIDSGSTTTIYLKNPLPVYIVYFTAFVSAQDELVYRRDIYERDDAIADALRKGY